MVLCVYVSKMFLVYICFFLCSVLFFLEDKADEKVTSNCDRHKYVNHKIYKQQENLPKMNQL